MPIFFGLECSPGSRDLSIIRSCYSSAPSFSVTDRARDRRSPCNRPDIILFEIHWLARYIALSLFKSAPKSDPTTQCNHNPDCLDVFCSCSNQIQCSLVTEYESKTFSCSSLNKIVDELKTAPKTSIPLLFYLCLQSGLQVIHFTLR